MARPDVLRQIRRFCLDCQGNASVEVGRCPDNACHLWPWRYGKNHAQTENYGSLLVSPCTNEEPIKLVSLQKIALRHVRKHCFNCAGDRKDIRQCTAKEECPLWSLRFGVYPATYKRVKARLAQGKRLSLFEE